MSLALFDPAPSMNAQLLCLFSFLLCIQISCSNASKTLPYVTSITPEIRTALSLSDFYRKQIQVASFSIVGSTNVSDDALREAAWIVTHLLEGRPDLTQAMTDSSTRLVVMAWNEFTSDIPEHSRLEPHAYWNRRARGLGATPTIPVVSCAEENLLSFPGDPYSTENICIHEFAHAIHETGLNKVDPTFDTRLQKAFHSATNAGLWINIYAASNHREYWAEAVQSWFDDNRENDDQHNSVNTRTELRTYDPGVAKLCEEIFADRPWRYVRPKRRPFKDCSHIKEKGKLPYPHFRWRETSPTSPTGKLTSP
ncbi:MAG: hypothetical protein EXS25_02035 [Pedosphaera sp.]|nr:hypothetical protein [Pedosphaera sp.]